MERSRYVGNVHALACAFGTTLQALRSSHARGRIAPHDAARETKRFTRDAEQVAVAAEEVSWHLGDVKVRFDLREDAVERGAIVPLAQSVIA